MHSLWEQDSWLEADVVVVGAGLIGVSTAIEYAELHAGKQVVLLERGYVPTGASTRNAGFACFGSVSEIAADIDLMGIDRAREIVQQRIEGLARLKARCRGNDIGYIDDGGHEIFCNDNPAIDRIDEVNNCIESVLGPQAFAIRNDLVAEYGLSNDVTTLIRTPFEATLDSGKLVRTLWNIALYHGVQIRTGAEVLNIHDHQDGVDLEIRTGTSSETIRAHQVVVAANAWIPDLIPSGTMPEIKPGRGQVLVTEALPNLRLRGSFHYDEGFYYFRQHGDRVLLGGGRNLDFEAECTTSHEITSTIQNALEKLLRQVIVPEYSNVQIEYRWSGTMAFTAQKQPFVARVMPHTIVAFGCNGMGVALSSAIATSAAAILG